MIKKILKYSLYIAIALFIALGYLSYFGIETKSFNSAIKKEILSKNKDLDIELKSIKILLDLKNLSINLKTSDPKLFFSENQLKLSEIVTNLTLKSIFDRNFIIDDLKITTNELKAKDLIAFLRLYNNSTQLFIFSKLIKDGNILAKINLNFDENGKIKNNFKIKGYVNNINLRLLKKQTIENLNFNFEIQNNEYLISNLNTKYEEIKFKSKSVNIIKKENFYLISGDVKTDNNELVVKKYSNLINDYLKNLKIKKINFTSVNEFSFKINKKLKLTDLNIKSKINISELEHKFDYPKIKKFLNFNNNLIDFKNHVVDLAYNKNKLIISGSGLFSINDNFEEINYEVIRENNSYKFKSSINFKTIPIIIKSMNYSKKNDDDSLLYLNGIFDKNKEIFFNKITFSNQKNNFSTKNLKLTSDFKINRFEEIKINFFNDKNIRNEIFIKNSNNNYDVIGSSYDASTLIDTMLKSSKDNNLFKLFNKLNSTFNIKIDQINLDQRFNINNLIGKIIVKDNKIKTLNLNSEFSTNKKLSFTIFTNNDGEKITTLFSDYSEPFVKKYKFIKGFEGGVLDFYSIKKNNISNSKLKIYDFKLHEMSALTKLLTLADPQGFTDLLTGEGVRFNDFEMDFQNQNNLMTIDEIYAIGPSISILMSGYVETDKLISLRGTLVPATTLNKVIGHIPYIGKILVGKKKGEGIFGVSFKIKGPPKNLKTTVNPIKTLTPRFITRTLEKVKKK